MTWTGEITSDEKRVAAVMEVMRYDDAAEPVLAERLSSDRADFLARYPFHEGGAPGGPWRGYDDLDIAVTVEEFSDAFTTFHGDGIPPRVVLDGQEWDDLNAELEAIAQPVAELRGAPHYVRVNAGLDFPNADQLAWERRDA